MYIDESADEEKPKETDIRWLYSRDDANPKF